MQEHHTMKKKPAEIEDDGQDEVPDENEGKEETVNQQELSEES